MRLYYPVSAQGAKITSPYGERVLKGKVQFHDGIDWSHDSDRRVFAITDGICVYDQDNYEHALRWVDKHHSAGNMIIIDHEIDGKLYHARYLHLIKNFIEKGERVIGKQQLGTFGDVGYSFGAHLHFDLWTEPWKKIDPTFLTEMMNG